MEVKGTTDQYLTKISWSPDEKIFYITVLNNETDHVWLNQYDAVTGSFVKTLLEETSKTYVEPLHPIMFTPDGKYFLWQSQQDGWNTFYKYDLSGKLVTKIAEGIIALDFIGF